jgi:hypothetical protein
MLAAGSIILATLGASGAAAAAPSTASVVTGNSDWYTQAYENFSTGGYLTPQQADVEGPQRAPFGTSSHKMTIGESSAQTELYRTNAYDGVNLSDLDRLEYSTLAQRTGGATSDRQPAYLRLSVDNDGTDDTHAIDTSLFFFPANNGTVVNDEWQSWDVSGGTIDVNGDNGGTTTLGAYASAHPDAVLVNAPYDSTHDAGAISLITGGALGGDGDPQTRGEYFVDRVIVGQNDTDTLFDLGGGNETDGDIADVTVDPAHDRGWRHQAYDNVDYFASNQEFVDGPGTAPAGGGSLRFTLDSEENEDRVELFRTENFDGTLVRDLRTIEFNTFQRATAGNTTPQQPAYLRLSVDNDGDGATDDSLFFLPANNGEVEQSSWQEWDAVNGGWSINGDNGQADTVTLEEYVVANPDATIVTNGDDAFPNQPRGGVAFMVGVAGANQMDAEFFLDDITFSAVDDATGAVSSGTEYDLEPTAPTVSVGNASVSEGNGGASLRFPVTLSRAFTVPVTVDFGTANGTAASGSDYRATAGTVTIPAGSTTRNVNVSVLSDKVREADESMSVRLSSPTNATVADGTGAGTIVNDDTRVAFAVARAGQRRVQVGVSTAPSASGAPVKVYRVLKSGRTQVLDTNLSSDGKVYVTLAKQYRRGTLVTMYATVNTANGLYTSDRDSVRIAR